MAGGVEYILRARDLLSGILNNAAKAADNVSKATDNVGKNTEKAMRASSRAVDYARRSWDNYIDKVRQSNNETNSLASGVKRLVGTLALLQGVKSVVKMGADLEASRISFDVLLGNHQKAMAMLGQINKFANATPYENQGLIDNAKMMLSFGTSAEKILPSLKMIGDIAMGDAQKMSSLTLAFSQMSSAGKLQGQDLLQMINAGFNPLQEMVKMTGKSMGKLREEMEKGKISSKMVEAAFQHATSKGGMFFEMMDKMSQTANGKLSTLVGSLKQTGAELGLKLLPYLNRFLDFMMPLADWIGRNGDMIIQLTAVLLGAYAAFQLITWGVKMWTIAQSILNGTMMLNPIGLVIAAIAALIALIVIAWNKFAWFRGGVTGLFEGVKSVISGFTTWIKGVWNGLKQMIKGIGDLFMVLWNGPLNNKYIQVALAVFLPFIGLPILIIKNWEKIKSFFIGIWQFVSSFFSGIKSSTMSIFDAIINWIKNKFIAFVGFLKSIFIPVFNFFSMLLSPLIDGVKSAFEWIRENVLNPLQKAGGWVLKKLGIDISAINKGFENIGKGASNINAASKKYAENASKAVSDGYAKGAKAVSKKESSGVDANSFFGGGSDKDKGNGKGTLDVKDKAKSIASGGSKPTNITINLNKEMVGQITINPLTMAQGAGEVKDKVMEVLSQILNSANRLAVD